MSDASNIYIPRQVVVQGRKQQTSQPLESFRATNAYVLLGEPGSGKSTVFEREAEALGDGARYTTVRDFLRSDLDDADRRRILFIDGMDEQRAAKGIDTPLDSLVTKLKKLGQPSFRLSCRAADWNQLDTKELKTVVQDGRIVELQLQPLSEEDIERVLESWMPARLSNPKKFIETAKQNGLESMLGNPMLIDLLVSAVSGDAWPESRTEIFQMACRRLAEEHSKSHERLAGTENVEELLDDAGILCALLLLSDRLTYLTLGRDTTSISVKDLSAHLDINAARATRALNTKMFVASDTERLYRHRLIAEFLAARALAKRLAHGLPVSRILALMGGRNGGIVDALRGLYGWLVSFSNHRDVLIQHDVLAVVYYGDVRDFTSETKRLVFETIHRATSLVPGLGRRDWYSKAFGALGTSDMASYLAEVLGRKRFDDADQVLLLSALEAIEHGQPMQALLPAVAAIARDARHWGIVRQAAVDVLVVQSGQQDRHMSLLLEEISAGSITDDDNELAGRLLGRLYPLSLSTDTLVRQFLRPPHISNFLGSYRHFWLFELWSKVPSTEVVLLVDLVCQMVIADEYWDESHMLSDLYYRSIQHASQQLGAQLTGEQLYRWISAGLDERGSRMTELFRSEELSQWLLVHPEKLKAVYEYGLVQLGSEGKSSQYWGWQHILLNNNQVPDDWYEWLLDVAARRNEEVVVRHCFGAAAYIAANAPHRFPGGLDLIYAWLQSNSERWPAAELWRAEETSKPMNSWERQERTYQTERDERIAAERAQRRDDLAPALQLVLAGGVSPGLMHDVLVVMEHGGYGIEGATPLQRVQSFVGRDAETAQHAIDSLADILDRGPLPSWSEVIELDQAKKKFLIQPVCLYAADKKWGQKDNVAGIADYPYALTLLAFSLVADRKPKWFDTVAKALPEQVALVMKMFLLNALQNKDERLSAVRWLVDYPQNSSAPTEVMNALIASMTRPFGTDFPGGQMGGILQAAVRYATPDVLANWVENVLSAPEATTAEKTVALTVSLAYSAQRFDELLTALSGNQSLGAVCSQVLEQPLPRVILSRLSVPMLGQLVQQLARLVVPRGAGFYSVNQDDRVRTGVTALLAEITSRTVEAASQELLRLQNDSELHAWRYKLSDSLVQNRRNVLDASFGHLDPMNVAVVLSNREPVSEADLIAFVLDHVDTLMRRIRFGGTNMLKIFWRADKHGNPIPYTENECRDRFLYFLNLDMAPMGVHIGKEQPTAREKRSDLTITFTRQGVHMSVPVEVKLDSHPKVWEAWETQLMALYAPDPAAGFHGVYLVMFAGYKTKLSPKRQSPSSAEEMAQIFSDLIPPAYHGRVHGRVLDLSWA